MHPTAPSALGRQELSRFSAEVFPCMRGVSDLVGPRDVWRLDDTLGVAFRSWDGVGTPISEISRLNTRPTCAPTNAWHSASRQTAHGSGSVWFANLYRTTPSFATPRWFIPALPHVPHARDATGVGASCISGAAVLIRPTKNPRPAPAASQRPAPVPRLDPSARLTHNETSTEVYAIHPSGLPLARDPLDGAGVLRLSLRASHPAVASDARRGWGQAIEHMPETTHPASGRSSYLRVHSLRATSCRSRMLRSSMRYSRAASNVWADAEG